MTDGHRASPPGKRRNRNNSEGETSRPWRDELDT